MTKAKAKKLTVASTKPAGRLIDKAAIEDGALAIRCDAEGLQAVNKAFASTHPDFVNYGMLQLTSLMTATGKEDFTVELNAAVAMLQGIAPTNELEAMLAAQMVATHHLTMALSRRTATADQIPQFEANGNMATKFSRTFVAQMDALSKLRRGGEQVVRHVHVNEGGQALIAGTVNTGGGRNE
jgi:hypothetical protein